MLPFKINLYICQYMFGITLNKTYMYASTRMLQINLINTSTSLLLKKKYIYKKMEYISHKIPKNDQL